MYGEPLIQLFSTLTRREFSSKNITWNEPQRCLTYLAELIHLYQL